MAGRAGMGSVAVFCAGGSSYYRIIRVTAGRDRFGLEVVAVAARADLMTRFGARRFRNNSPIAQYVTHCGDGLIGGVIAAAAGFVICKAVLGAGRLLTGKFSPMALSENG